MIKIYDEMEPKPTLDEILDKSKETRIDRILGANIHPETQIYMNEATRHLADKRRERLTDTILIDKLYFLLKQIDKSAMNEPELADLNNIIAKYRFIPKKKSD